MLKVCSIILIWHLYELLNLYEVRDGILKLSIFLEVFQAVRRKVYKIGDQHHAALRTFTLKICSRTLKAQRKSKEFL